jgi:hypothetical protein
VDKATINEVSRILSTGLAIAKWQSLRRSMSREVRVVIAYILQYAKRWRNSNIRVIKPSTMRCICPNCRPGAPARDMTRKNCAPCSHSRDMFCILPGNYIHSDRLSKLIREGTSWSWRLI